MTDQKRIEGRKLAEAATPGEWSIAGELTLYDFRVVLAEDKKIGVTSLSTENAAFIAHHDPDYVRELYDALDAAEAEATDLDEDRVFAIVWAMKAEEDLELVSGELQRWINRDHEAKQEAKRERARAEKAEAALDERDKGVAMQLEIIEELTGKFNAAMDTLFDTQRSRDDWKLEAERQMGELERYENAIPFTDDDRSELEACEQGEPVLIEPEAVLAICRRIKWQSEKIAQLGKTLSVRDATVMEQREEILSLTSERAEGPEVGT